MEAVQECLAFDVFVSVEQVFYYEIRILAEDQICQLDC